MLSPYVVFSGSDSIIVEERATNVLETARLAIPRMARSVRRYAGQSGGKTPRPTHRRSATPRAASAAKQALPNPLDAGSLIGKRVGRGHANLAAALERPEKLRRDAL